MRNRSPAAAGALVLAVLIAPVAAPVAAQSPPSFRHVVVDPDNPANPHCKGLGDVDGDGLLDGIVASSAGDGMHWYEAPGWTKHAIRASGSWTTDMQVGDVDGDGDPDVVIPNASGVFWYENPRPGGDPRTDPWSEHLIGAAGANHHDVEIGDVDLDLDLDVVTRKKNGGATYLWRQQTPTSWTRITVSTRSGEGTALGDLDGDLDLDVAGNGFWVEQLSPTSWTEHEIAAGWPADVGVEIADVDGDLAPDVVLGPSESPGRLSWYQAADPVSGPWTEHPIDATVSYLHTFEAADMDADGDLDLVTAEMHQSSDPDEVSVYLNLGGGLAWSQLVLAETGSHNLRVGDLGADGDLDVFGANWNDSAPNSAVVELWENQTEGVLPLGLWQRHILETALPWQAVFVDARDLDGDGRPDLVTGGWWYPNPGALGGVWSRTAIGSPFHNFAAVHDFDGDGDADLLGTDGQVSGSDLLWARNDGSAAFTLFDIADPAPAGDFLQGVSVGQLLAGGGDEVVLSWHNGASGTRALTVPADPTSPAWPATTLSATTNMEQVPIGDLDGDADVDVHLGTDWLRQNPGGGFEVRPGVPLSAGVPDRVVLGDLDGDADLDVVIGAEFQNLLIWGENQGAGSTWTERPIATDVQYFSVDVGDVDRDGDLDVVGGAHQGNGEVFLYENDGGGGGWNPWIVDPGDSSLIDHHDGTRLVDLDLDGDLDIVSIGWTKRSLVVYENLAIGGGDSTPPRLDSVVAAGNPRRVVAVFDEPLDPASAQAAGNYSITPGVAVTAAALGNDGRTVTLTTSLLQSGIEYTLAVTGVRDLAGNTVAPGTEMPFVYTYVSPGGLVAHWPFDEGAGTTAFDASGGGHHGALAGGPAWTPEPALEFDGADDRVDAGAFDLAGEEVTLAAWIRPADLANCVASDCRILSKAAGTAEQDHWFMLSTIDAGGAVRLRFRLKAGGSTATLIASSGDLAEDVWQHAAAVFDGAEMRLYLDGQPVGTLPHAGTVSPGAGIDVWVGGNPPDATGRPWAGRIDDVRIYARALSPAEIQGLPGPGRVTLLRDGFESGDTSRWSATVP